jgi:hypothetical protein
MQGRKRDGLNANRPMAGAQGAVDGLHENTTESNLFHGCIDKGKTQAGKRITPQRQFRHQRKIRFHIGLDPYDPPHERQA